jgi:hypothetical protein
MPMTPAAAKKYKPRRTPESLDEVIYPETRAKMQEAKADVADAKDTEAATETYNKVVGKKGGGTASSRADGIASRGKTNCKIC